MKPEPNVIRFVRRYFSKPGCILDIGSWVGNHAHFFEEEGWNVTAIDIDPRARAHIHGDIRLIVIPPESFDFILDHNALCHVVDPPWKKIHEWLKPNGIFLCVHPTENTWHGVAEGKKFTRFASGREIVDNLAMFRNVEIWPSSYPDFKGHLIRSHIAWGWK